MKSKRFYLACLRDTVGTNVSFHGKGGQGYCTNVDAARMYTFEEAQQAWGSFREFDLPLCADQVDNLTEWHVDCQVIPCETTIVSGCTEYVAFKAGRWNGNDVFWLTSEGSVTCDFMQAAKHAKPLKDRTHQGFIWLPWSLANDVKRRTFDVALINRRSMVQSAGLIMPDRIKRIRRLKGKEFHWYK